MSDLFQERNPATAEVKIIGTVISEVGAPCRLAPKLEMPIELATDDEYDGWVVPFTLATDILTLFKMFGLWQSSNGLMLEGRRFTSLSRGVATATTRHPILVGDYLDGRPVLRAENRYNDAKKTWTVRVMHGTPPEALEITPVQYKYYESILNSDIAMRDELINFIDKLFNEVLPLVMTIDGKKLEISAAKPLFEQYKKLASDNIQKSLDEQETWQWHL